MKILSLEKFAFWKKSKDIYLQADPFPFAKIENLWADDFLGRVSQEFEVFNKWEPEKNQSYVGSKKYCTDTRLFPKRTRQIVEFCNSPLFLKFLEGLTGETALIPDPHLSGGGMNSSGNGGFLKLHVDFNWHERLRLYRRLNLLIYLNQNWSEDWGGSLEFARKNNANKPQSFQSITPHFNTTIIFTTTDKSYHGFPMPMNLPHDRRRNSIALYYYVSKEPEEGNSSKSTVTKYIN